MGAPEFWSRALLFHGFPSEHQRYQHPRKICIAPLRQGFPGLRLFIAETLTIETPAFRDNNLLLQAKLGRSLRLQWHIDIFREAAQ